MKLAKKMLACAMALAMVAALALTAFAAPAIKMTASDAVVGKTVTIAVSAVDMAGLMSADLEFHYDEAALEFVSIEEAADATTDLTEGDKFDAGKISFSLLYKKAATADSNFAVITFKVLKAGATDVEVIINSWDGTAEEAAATKVTVNAVEAPTEDTDKPADTEKDPAKPETSTKGDIPKAGDAGVAAIAGVMAIAAVAFVATRKKDEE